MTEFDQLCESLLFGSDASATEVDPTSLKQLETEYEQFCDRVPDCINISEDCLVCVSGDPFTQFAHDYVMTRMGHGVGFWETSDWEEYAGKILTKMCREQGPLETITEDGIVYVC